MPLFNKKIKLLTKKHELLYFFLTRSIRIYFFCITARLYNE